MSNSLAQNQTVPSNTNAAAPTTSETEEIVPLRELENREISRALRICNGNVRMAARKLGIGRATLYRKLAALRPDTRPAAPVEERREEHVLDRAS